MEESNGDEEMNPSKKQNLPSHWPTGWPSDNRSRINNVEGILILYHPDRNPHEWIEYLKEWKERK